MVLLTILYHTTPLASFTIWIKANYKSNPNPTPTSIYVTRNLGSRYSPILPAPNVLPFAPSTTLLMRHSALNMATARDGIATTTQSHDALHQSHPRRRFQHCCWTPTTTIGSYARTISVATRFGAALAWLTWLPTRANRHRFC